MYQEAKCRIKIQNWRISLKQKLNREPIKRNKLIVISNGRTLASCAMPKGIQRGRFSKAYEWNIWNSLNALEK